MEPLLIPNKDRSSLLISLIFWVLFWVLMCYVVYVTIQKEGLTIEIIIVALVFVLGLAFVIKMKVDQLRRYTPYGITVTAEGITFSGSLNHPTVFIAWDMMKGFTTRTISIKWSTVTSLIIFLSDPDTFYKLYPSAKTLFGEKDIYNFPLQDVDCEPKEILTMIMEYHNKMIEAKKSTINLS
jgi:hypothetical protein